MNLNKKIKYLDNLGWSKEMIYNQLLIDYNLTDDLNKIMIDDIKKIIKKKNPFEYIITAAAGIIVMGTMMDFVFGKNK